MLMQLFVMAIDWFGLIAVNFHAKYYLLTQVAFFADRWALPAGSQIAAATNASFATSAEGQLFSWGKLKVNGDNQTYPAMMQDLAVGRGRTGYGMNAKQVGMIK